MRVNSREWRIDRTERTRPSPPRRPLRSVASAAALALLAVLPALGSAQGARADVGSFTLYVNGQRAGREQFSLQSLTGADGASYELRAESAVGQRRSAVRLTVDSAGSPLRYTIEERDGTQVAFRLSGQRVRGRFATLSRSTRGESAREYVLEPGAIVLEQDGLHQHAMLVRGRTMTPGDSVTLPTLSPARNDQGTVHLLLQADDDTVTVGGMLRPALRWQATTRSSGNNSSGTDGRSDERRTIWADREGRVLRVRIPSRGLDALRDDVPR